MLRILAGLDVPPISSYMVKKAALTAVVDVRPDNKGNIDDHSIAWCATLNKVLLSVCIKFTDALPLSPTYAP